MSRSSIAISCLFLLVGCGGISGSGLSASGGSTGSGGAIGVGGAIGLGGNIGSGGALSSGGTTTAIGSGGAASGGTTSATTSSGGTGSGGRIGTGGAGPGTGGAGPGAGGTITGTGGTKPGAGGTTVPAGTGGSPATGGTTTGSCTSPPDPSPLVGWASQSGSTSGGGSATPTTVTTLAALQAAVKGNTAAVIYVKGVMAAGTVAIGSNKTIAGLCGAELHGHVDISGSSNVIVRNIKIVGYAVGNCSLDPSYDSTVGCSSGDDAISVQNSANHIWFDHCDISDGTDGNLDITTGSDFVTVSWTKFHYTPRTDNTGSDSTGAAGHRYSNLVGGADNMAGDVGKLNVTWHHDWWADNVMERQPRVRYGKNHVLNSLYTCAGDNYCVRAGMDAQILVESSVFNGIKTPQQFNSTADQGTSYITVTNNLYSSVSGTQATGGGGTPFTTPPYTYTADATAGLQAAIQAGAGPH